jgi:3-hydroxyisobutyrate dehydrogenase-like beta-hydroxyacid dehydrogenase
MDSPSYSRPTSVIPMSDSPSDAVPPVAVTTKSIGFIGLGIMGEGMAARLLHEGVAGTTERPLVVWNRTPSKCQALQDAFPNSNIMTQSTPRNVVELCDITYSMLSTPEVSRQVFEGEDGVLAGVSAGKSIVDCATLAEADMKRMNDAIVAKGGYVYLFVV